MEIRTRPLPPRSAPIRPSTQVPLRKRLADLRQTIRKAVDDDIDQQQFLLDDLDLDWLASLPKTLPRGSLLNVVI